MKFKTSYLTDITEVRASDVEGVGVCRWRKDSNGYYRCYKWVLLTSTTVTAAIGNALTYKATDLSFTTVTPDVSEGIGAGTYGVLAGMIMKVDPDDDSTAYTAPTTGQYFWMQIKGYSDIFAAAPTGTTPAVGDAICMSATDAKFKNDPAANESAAGFLLNVTGSSERAYLDCPY